MTDFTFANNINTLLAGAISNSATSITLASTLNLPTSIPGGTVLALTLNDAATRQNFEIVYVTAITGATLTVLRAQEDTTALAWSVGDYAFSGVTAGQMRSFEVPAGGVTSFNTRTGAVTLIAADVDAVGAVVLSASTGTMTAVATSANPTSSVDTLAYTAYGGFGGGFGLVDGTFNWGLYDESGTLCIGAGSSLGALTNKYTFDPSGNFIAVGNVTAAGELVTGQNVASSSTVLVLGTVSAGSIHLRPDGTGSSTGEAVLNSAGSLTVAGGMTIGTGQVYNISDERAKHGIEPLAVNTTAWSELAKEWCYWFYNADDSYGQGITAQKLLEHAPKYVRVPEDPEVMLAVNIPGAAFEAALAAHLRLDELIEHLRILGIR